MKKYVESMVVNITDICNMECEFCLRGDRGHRKLDLELIPRMFDGIDAIETLTITGGEPSCYIKAVTAIVAYLSSNQDKIAVNGFYIVTNGKVYVQELVDAIKEMMFIYLQKQYGSTKYVAYKDSYFFNAMIEELNYQFAISVSLDKFHEPINILNYLKYRTSGIYSTIKEQDFSKGGIIERGRGTGLLGAHYREYREFSVETETDAINVSEIYVTVEGKIFGDCDMSYEMEEYNEPAGDLYDETLAQIIQRYADEEQTEDDYE